MHMHRTLSFHGKAHRMQGHGQGYPSDPGSSRSSLSDTRAAHLVVGAARLGIKARQGWEALDGPHVVATSTSRGRELSLPVRSRR